MSGEREYLFEIETVDGDFSLVAGESVSHALARWHSHLLASRVPFPIVARVELISAAKYTAIIVGANGAILKVTP